MSPRNRKADGPLEVVLPRRSRGHQSREAGEKWEADVQAFCAALEQIRSGVSFPVSARGWCYLMEPHGLSKNDFDLGEKFINDCRKSGLLPVDFCARDTGRPTENIQSSYFDDETPEEYVEALAERRVEEFRDARRQAEQDDDDYQPVTFHGMTKVYVEMIVEKIDLVGLFAPVCAKYHVPVTNAGGWPDLWTRYDLMTRMKEHEAAGHRCVLLQCGDFDPGGLRISGKLRDNLEAMGPAADWDPADLEIVRFGLDFDFIQEHKLTWIDNLKTSSKAKDAKSLDDPEHNDHDKSYVQDYIRKYGVRKVEANALLRIPRDAHRLCRDAIERYISPKDVEAYDERIREGRRRANGLLPQALIDAGLNNSDQEGS